MLDKPRMVADNEERSRLVSSLRVSCAWPETQSVS